MIKQLPKGAALPAILVWVALVLLAGCATTTAPGEGVRQRPNILVITVDDMNADSVGVFGSAVPQVTPNIDSLARAGLRFERAHVQVANCMPSRNVMWSGRYPHSNRVEGFVSVPDPGYPTLAEVLHEAGYFTAIRHKLKDSTPYRPFPWDRVLDDHHAGGKPHRKDAASYGASVTDGIDSANSAGKPFFLLINIADPHLPFYGLDKQGEPVADPFTPSRIYAVDEVEVPGFLPDTPVVREELAHYFSTVRRADDAVGAVLRALESSGQADNTLVLFVSDHGMPFPFAKTQLYHHSTRTPLILRWPGHVAADAVDRDHMVSAVDFMPTLLAAVGEDSPAGVQGRSFLPLLLGEPQAGREAVFKTYNENSAGQRAPMRAIESGRYLYLYNPWSNGRRVLRSATLRMQSFAEIVSLAQTDAFWAGRLQQLQHRTLEEFYDLSTDPDCLDNRIDDPSLSGVIAAHRAQMEQAMMTTGDPALPAFQGRDDPAQVQAYMAEQVAAQRARAEWRRQIRERLRDGSGPAAK